MYFCDADKRSVESMVLVLVDPNQEMKITIQ